MKHAWEDHPPARLLGNRRRQCAHCKKIQVIYSDTWYGRVMNYRWIPLAGRCAGKPQPPSKEEIEIAGVRAKPKKPERQRRKKL